MRDMTCQDPAGCSNPAHEIIDRKYLCRTHAHLLKQKQYGRSGCFTCWDAKLRKGEKCQVCGRIAA